MKTALYILTLIITLFTGCGDTINNNPYTPPSYNEILTISLPDNYSLKLYTSDTDSLTYGYNDVFFKVWLSSAEQNTGYVKVYPEMRMTPHITHSTPVSDSFAYNSTTGYYKGYIIFNMPTTPPELVWKTTFTYMDINGMTHETDSVPLYNSYHSERQVKLFYDLFDTTDYILTLVKPFTPAAGLNDFTVLLHKSDEYQLNFEQILNAQMYINVYKSDSLYSTDGNVNPVINAEGYYKGKINIPHKGTWIVGDTIVYNGRVITNNPPPLPGFNISIE